MTKRSQVIAVRLSLGLLVLVAIGMQLGVHLRLDLSASNFFSYFTNLSNLLAAAVFVLGASQIAANRPTGPRFDLLRWISAANMTAVGIVFAVLLRDADLGSLMPWVNVLLHYVMPVVVVVDWLVCPPDTQIEIGDMAVVLVLPALYLGYTVVRGALIDWYPYPFLNPAKVHGYLGVFGYAVGIAATFAVIAWALMAAGNRLRATASAEASSRGR